MDLNPVILAIPIYFGLMGLELVYEAITHKKTYRLNDAITNINLGTLDQVTGTFVQVIKIGIYTVIYEQFAFYQIPATWGTFIVLFFLYDLCYYWSHRMAHEVSLFWGGHVVHHQSEDFNLSVALRQSSTSFFWSFPFYIPLALIGFSPMQLVFVGGFNLLYQFWIHTEHVGKMGWLEYIMNTPSHHRVHHGRDPKYIDKNYAGVFIIWDRLFGTFTEEEERPTYGITKPLNSWNPVYANIAHYVNLWKGVRQTHSLGDAVQMLFRRPGWQPDYLGGPQNPQAVAPTYQKYNADAPLQWAKLYIFVHFLLAIGPISYFLFNVETLPFVLQGPFAVWIIVTTVIFGLLFESNRTWIAVLEVTRLLALPLGAYGLWTLDLGVPRWMIGLTAAIVFLSVPLFLRLFAAMRSSP